MSQRVRFVLMSLAAAIAYQAIAILIFAAIGDLDLPTWLRLQFPSTLVPLLIWSLTLWTLCALAAAIVVGWLIFRFVPKTPSGVALAASCVPPALLVIYFSLNSWFVLPTPFNVHFAVFCLEDAAALPLVVLAFRASPSNNRWRGP